MPKNLILLHDNTSHIQEGDTANNGLWNHEAPSLQMT
jgi:hypothetical protein